MLPTINDATDCLRNLNPPRRHAIFKVDCCSRPMLFYENQCIAT